MFSFDEVISSKLDGWTDGYPGRVFAATLAAKYLVWAFLGAAIVGYRVIEHGQAIEQVLYWIALFFTVIVPHLFTLVLSLIVRRKRPYERLPDSWHLPIRVYTPSFPSGHATIAFAIASFLVIYWQVALPAALVLFAVAGLVALARVLVGVHYVTDVLVGSLIGGFGGWLTFRLLNQILSFFWM